MSEAEPDFFETFHFFATTSQDHMAKTFPEVKEISIFDWDHYVSIIAFYLTLNKIKAASPDDKTHETVLGDIYRRFVEIFPNFIDEKAKLMDFMQGKSFDDREDFFGTLGLWLACNLYGRTIHEVTPDEFRIGVLTTEVIADDILNYYG